MTNGEYDNRRPTAATAHEPPAVQRRPRLLQGLNSGPHTKVVTLIFGAGTSPDVVVKRIRHPSYSSRLFREYEKTLKAYETMDPGGLRVPQPLELDRQLGSFSQTVVPGSSIFKQVRFRGHKLGTRRLQEALKTARDVERQLASATPAVDLTVEHSGPADWSNLVELSIRVHGVDEETANGVRSELRDCVEILDESGCKYRAQHGDFWAGNLILGQKPALVDWEWWGWIDLPCFDIVFLGLTMARWLRPGKRSWRWFPADSSWLPHLRDDQGSAGIINQWMYTAAGERLGVGFGSAMRYIRALRALCPAMLSVRDYTVVGHPTDGDEEWHALLRYTLHADHAPSGA